MRLYLVRHGQTAWNAEERAQGHADIPLNETGLDQAAALEYAFRDVPVDLVLCSDLQRAKDTALPIVRETRARYEETPLLRERGFGDWEGDPFHEIVNRWVGLEVLQRKSRLELRPPNGESFLDVWDRIAPLVDRLYAATENIAIVSHGGTCGVLLARLLSGSLETCRSFRFANTSVTALGRRADGRFFIDRYNDTSHLEEPTSMVGSVDGASR